MTQPPAAEQPFSQKIFVKVLAVFILILALLIPLSMIKSTLTERLQRRNEAVADITSSWGREQVIVGPVVVVPYRYTYKTFKDVIVKGEIRKTEVLAVATTRAWFLPDELQVDGGIAPERLHRGIYEAVVYRGEVKFSGRFPDPDFRALKVEADQILWDDAEITLAVTDLRGTGEALRCRLGDKVFRLEPGTGLEGFSSGVRARIGSLAKSLAAHPFSLELGFKGSGGINFAPVGIQNRVKLSSPWADPSFRGQFLPAERTVSEKGFDALWKVSYYGRAFPQAAPGAFPADAVNGSLFGVSFLNAVDSYRMVERATKYGALFLTLVFAAFFLFETVVPLRIHVAQYTLVGAAMCLFYLALLSMSEFIAFGWAYLAASTAAIMVISLYSRAILQGGNLTAAVTAELAVIYGFLYVSLQLQDYSLLLGTVGLFMVLSVLMYATRNVDWYALEKGVTNS